METLIPAFLRRQRNQRRLTLENLSAKVGMSPQHLSEIESGKRDPRLSSIERMSSFRSLAEFLSRAESLPRPTNKKPTSVRWRSFSARSSNMSLHEFSQGLRKTSVDAIRRGSP